MKSDWWRCIISLAAVLPIGIGALQTRQQDETTPRDQLQYAAHYFDQQINHFPDDEQFAKSNLSHGTFTQRYYYDTSYYKPGWYFSNPPNIYFSTYMIANDFLQAVRYTCTYPARPAGPAGSPTCRRGLSRS